MPLMLSACVYAPVIDEAQNPDSNCQTFTKHMSMQDVLAKSPPNEHPLRVAAGCGGECAVAVLAAAIVVSGGSAIISGSIVLTNNTVHWLEYQGVCSDSYLNTKKQNFLDSFDSAKPASRS